MSDTGQTLREARESKQVTIAQAAEVTRIKSSHLEDMERNRFDGFAAPIYARGFLRSYAEYLGLDPHPLLEDYQRRSGPPTAPVQIPNKVFRSSTTPHELAPETFPTEAEPELSEPVARTAPAPNPPAPLPIMPTAPDPKPPTPELDLFSAPVPTLTSIPTPAPAPGIRAPTPAARAIPAPPPSPPEPSTRPERSEPTEPETAPEREFEPEEARSFKPLIYGAVAALVIGLLLSRCADRKTAAAPKPEADAILIEPLPEPFFPVRRAPPAAQPAP